MDSLLGAATLPVNQAAGSRLGLSLHLSPGDSAETVPIKATASPFISADGTLPHQ
jgi:hypothetical protein